MGRIFKIIILVGLVIGVFYLGACVYANFFQKDTSEYQVPSFKQAQYQITILNTRNVFYTNEYSIEGTKITCYGYWERIGDRYKYREHSFLVLDKKIFGEITVRRR